MQDKISKIIDAAVEVHRQLGVGLLECVYESSLCHELALRGMASKRQLPIPVIYKNTIVRDPLFLDILVEDEIIVEVKANGIEYPYYEAQLYTHLKLLEKKWGLLINFGKNNLLDGIKKVSVIV